MSYLVEALRQLLVLQLLFLALFQVIHYNLYTYVFGERKICLFVDFMKVLKFLQKSKFIELQKNFSNLKLKKYINVLYNLQTIAFLISTGQISASK